MDAEVAARLKEKQTNPLEAYREYAYYQFADDGEGLALRESRQALVGMDTPDIRILDEIVIEAAIANDYINPVLLDDKKDRSLVYWWWHLGKIRIHKYDADLLPAHLREVYQASYLS